MSVTRPTIEPTPASAMFAAYDNLLAASERFHAAGDTERSVQVRGLADDVAAEDPRLQDRIWAALPSPGYRKARPEDIADLAGVDLRVVYRALERLRRQGKAATGGGWWGQR